MTKEENHLPTYSMKMDNAKLPNMQKLLKNEKQIAKRKPLLKKKLKEIHTFLGKYKVGPIKDRTFKQTNFLKKKIENVIMTMLHRKALGPDSLTGNF